MTKRGGFLFPDGDVLILRQTDSESNLQRLASSLDTFQPPKRVLVFRDCVAGERE